MGRISKAELYYYILVGMVLLEFMVPAFGGDTFLLFPGLIIIGAMFTAGSVRIPLYIRVCIAVFLLSCCLGYIVTPYKQNFAILSFFVIGTLAIFIENIVAKNLFKSDKYDAFYYIMFFLVCISTILGERGDADSIVFRALGDKNYTAVFVYVLFLISNKQNKILGVLFSVAYSIIFINSRSFILLIVLFYITMYFRETVIRIKHKMRISYFGLMLLLFGVSMALSILWVYAISSSGVNEYHAGLNDTANRIRFVSNIRSFQFLFEDLKKSLFCGYGYDYVSELGVDVTYSQLPVYMGSKILQAHNSYLNFFNKVGIVPGLFYFYMLGRILEKFDEKDNCYYIIPFLVNSMFMHSLLNGTWILLFTLVLLMPQRKGRICRMSTRIVFLERMEKKHKL